MQVWLEITLRATNVQGSLPPSVHRPKRNNALNATQHCSNAKDALTFGRKPKRLKLRAVMTTNRMRQIFLGSELNDAELEDIPSARVELHAHVLTKFVQVGNDDKSHPPLSQLSYSCTCRCQASWVPASLDLSLASNAGDHWQPPSERCLR